MSVVIKLENLGKRYRLGDINRRMLYEDMQRFWARLRGKPDPFARRVNAPGRDSHAGTTTRRKQIAGR